MSERDKADGLWKIVVAGGGFFYDKHSLARAQVDEFLKWFEACNPTFMHEFPDGETFVTNNPNALSAWSERMKP